ncbi:MAG TPA: hypothetical protein VNO70_26730, partial [Blastocatellia bacterium]|nr:hypothetical protein [Blastocatellia bacterium]
SKEAIAAVERLGGRVKAVFPAMAAEIKETGEAVSRFPDAAEEAMRRFGEAAESGMKALEREFEKLPDRLGKTSKDFGEWVREQARLWDSLKGLVGEALAGVIATISRMFGAGLAEAERWTGRIVGVIDTLPGAFGDAARQAARTVSEWADFFDSVLKLLHEFNAKIPASLGELVKVVVDKMGQLNLAVFGKLRELGVGIAATLGGILGVGGQGPIGGAISGGLLGFGIGKLLHGIFNTFLTSILPGLGAAVGGIIGLFKGLFGGKSKEQQEAERLNLERLKQDLQKQATDIANTAISAMRNALDLFKELEHFTGVPKKAISRFFAALEITLRDFLALSVKFKFELIEAAGKFAEAIAPAIELIGAAVQAFALLRGHEDTPVSSINAIASDLEEAGLALVAASDKFEREHLGQIKKFSKKMLEGVSLLQAALEFFKGLREHADTPKETLALFFNDLDETLALLRERAESWGKHALNVIRDFSVRVSAAVEGLAAPLEFFKGLREHTQSAREQLVIFFTDLDELLAVLAARAKGFSVEALAEVEVYARNIARIPALLVEAAEFFRSLRDADDLPQQAAQNLITDLTEFLDLLKRLNELAASALVEADGFRSMAQKVADSLRAGVEAIAAAGGALAQAGAWRRASLTPQAAPPASRSQTIYVTVQVDARSIREIQDIITLFDSLPLAARQAAG